MACETSASLSDSSDSTCLMIPVQQYSHSKDLMIFLAILDLKSLKFVLNQIKESHSNNELDSKNECFFFERKFKMKLLKQGKKIRQMLNLKRDIKASILFYNSELGMIKYEKYLKHDKNDIKLLLNYFSMSRKDKNISEQKMKYSAH
ncbi:hypothetical protein BpHYR1_005244 [Brachionus plicatilis]|uniref:Uncharacterized protein n=1 Tax=Brachionus plicatilis TaxID=10195 RepID=A0A3M7SK63_BRAPC|nr:hypothetical protein BpHYR1_005244 [Brachionus plicatilis]